MREEEKQRENTLRHTGGHAPVIMRVGLLKKEGGARRWEEGYLSLFPPSALVFGVPKGRKSLPELWLLDKSRVPK